jgi:hypothetical protein
MEIKKKNYPKGDLVTSGDIIIDGDSYLLVGWDYVKQKAITIDLSETTNNVRIYNNGDEIRTKYKNNRIIKACDIVLSFNE